MNAKADIRLPPWFRSVAVAAIVWNLLGVGAYIADVTRSADSLATLPAAERALYASVPTWATGAYAIAVFAGLGGGVLLTLRKKYATHLFALSFAGVALQMLHAFALADTLAILGPSSAIMPAIIVVIAAVLMWFSLNARRRGWLN